MPPFQGSPQHHLHLIGVQHASSHTPFLGYGLPPANQPPAQWWGPWGPPPPWAQYYQQWPTLPSPAAPNNLNNTYDQQSYSLPQGQPNAQQANHPLVASYNAHNDDAQGNQTDQPDQQLVDPLVNALAVSTVPGKQQEPILSMHVSQSLKKHIWAGEYIDLAYLLETNSVPEDKKSYEFACSSNSTNKLTSPQLNLKLR